MPTRPTTRPRAPLPPLPGSSGAWREAIAKLTIAHAARPKLTASSARPPVRSSGRNQATCPAVIDNSTTCVEASRMVRRSSARALLLLTWASRPVACSRLSKTRVHWAVRSASARTACHCWVQTGVLPTADGPTLTGPGRPVRAAAASSRWRRGTSVAGAQVSINLFSHPSVKASPRRISTARSVCRASTLWPRTASRRGEIPRRGRGSGSDRRMPPWSGDAMSPSRSRTRSGRAAGTIERRQTASDSACTRYPGAYQGADSRSNYSAGFGAVPLKGEGRR